MAAGINDKFKKVSADNSYSVATTVKTARTVGGGTTLEAFDLSKWADATAVNFLTYRKTTNPVTNITTVTNRAGWTALVNTSSNTLTNLTIAPGYTDLGQQVGDYIEPVQTSKWANDLVDGILVSHNQDGSLKNNAVSTAKIGDNQVTTAKLADSSVTAGKLDLASFTPIYDNVITQSGKTYTITVKGIYMAWGTSSNTTGNPSAEVVMNGVVKAKSITTTSGGNWSGATAIATGLLDVGQTIVINQSNAAATDNRSSVGMCLTQRVA